MAFTYDPVFAVDPQNPSNAAKNASITIFDPADPSQAPVTITDPTGVPLANPITVDAAGMGPAFQHATLARVGWKGAGFVGYFTSYEGMFNETVAAKEAAQTAEGATTAALALVEGAVQAPTDEQVDAGIVRAGIPAIVADVVAAEPTVLAAAEAAVTDAAATMDLVTGQDARLPQPIADITGWTHINADAAGKIISGIRTDGTYYFRSLEAPALSSVRKVAGYGDSMLGDHFNLGTTTLTALEAALGVEVHKGGVPGQTSTEAALRQGGLDVFINVTGNSIPASGAVAVTVVSPTAMWKTGSAWTFLGTLAGIPGTLAKSTTDTWTFTRTTAGSVTAAPPESRWISDGANTRADWVHIFRAGRNNVSQATVIRDYRAMAKFVAGTKKRYLALPIYNATTEPSGSTGYNNIAAINAALADEYGPNYYDLRGWLIRNGLAAAGITPTADDTTAIAEDRIPPSLMMDTMHLTAVGRTVEGNRLAQVIREKGWI